MKLVAKKDFLNVPALNIALDEKTPGFVNPNHVHMGHRFTIGRSETFAELSDDDKDVVVRLISSESAVIDSPENKTVIAEIDARARRQSAKPQTPAAPPAKQV